MNRIIARLFRLFAQREKTARGGQTSLFLDVRRAERRLWDNIERSLFGLDVSSAGRLTPRNIALRNSIAAQAQAQWETEKPGLAANLLRTFRRLTGLNGQHFGAISEQGAAAVLTAEQRVLQAYGLDPATGLLLPGSYLDAVLAPNLSQTVAQQMQALLADPNITLEELRDRLRAAFLGQGRAGMALAHFQRFTRDLQMQFDRQLQNESAALLGLTHFVYAGTRVRDSRSHCLDRLNLVYTLEEEAKWEARQWAGKIPGIPVSLQMGGYNCTHSRMFVSKEMAQVIAANAGFPIDSYR